LKRPPPKQEISSLNSGAASGKKGNFLKARNDGWTRKEDKKASSSGRQTLKNARKKDVGKKARTA